MNYHRKVYLQMKNKLFLQIIVQNNLFNTGTRKSRKLLMTGNCDKKCLHNPYYHTSIYIYI